MSTYKPMYYLERIEQNELELTKLNAARSLVHVQRQLETLQIGNAILLRDQTDPTSPYYNRVKGFGLLELPKLDEILSYYAAAPSFDMTPNHMTEEIARALNDRAYIPMEQLVFMYTHTREVYEAVPEFHIERVTEESAEEFVQWIGHSMGGKTFGEEVITRSKSYFYSPQFVNYMLRIDGKPAAMGSLFINGDEAYIANDYTFEAYRGRGCQSALLRQRLSDARRLGIRMVYTDVVFGSVSHGNMERLGFKTAYLNTLWMKK